MPGRFLYLFVLAVIGIIQFLVVPIFSNMALGAKVVLFLIFVIFLAMEMVRKKEEWILPVVFIPLVCLAAVFLISLSYSTLPLIGIVDFGTFAIALLFCLLVANIPCEYESLQKGIQDWLKIIGVIVALLCLYQYVDFLLYGQKTEILIPYLLPPGSIRVNGVYGQSNMTALLLCLSIIAFLSGYISRKNITSSFNKNLYDAGLFTVSLAFILTGSRAGYLSLILTSIIFIFLILRKSNYYPVSLFKKPFLIIAIAFFVTLVPVASDIIPSANTHVAISVDARFFFWMDSILTFKDFPILGAGLDHFKVFLPSHARQAHDILGFIEYGSMGYSDWAHNEYLQILAESGIIGFLCLSVFLILFFHLMFKEVLYKKNQDTDRTCLFLMTIPFFNQGMFSWPFRHPALLCIFFLILGALLVKTPAFRVTLSSFSKTIIMVILVVFFLATSYFSYKENHFLQLKQEVKKSGCRTAAIIPAMDDSYLGFKLMREVLPMCVQDGNFLNDSTLVEKYLPYFEKIAYLQGTYSQWYNLGLVYRSLGDYDRAEKALKKSVERQPEFELGWSVLHSLHIEEAVRQTGRPMADFLPPEKTLSTDYYDSIFKRQ